MSRRIEIGRVCWLNAKMILATQKIKDEKKRAAIKFRWFMWRQRQIVFRDDSYARATSG